MSGWRKLLWVTGGIGGLIMFLAGVSPGDAASNLGKWAELVGVADIPSWLATESADFWGGVIGAAIAASSIGLIIASKIFHTQSKQIDTAELEGIIQGDVSSLPIITVKLAQAAPPINNFTPVCAIQITNNGPELKEACLAQIEGHGLGVYMPDPFVIRTEGQIRGDRIGRFTLSAGQTKTIPILFRHPGRINSFRFFSESGDYYDFVVDSAEFVVAIYGAATPTKVCVKISVGEDFKTRCELETC
jgi:hypothetical protein